MTAPSQDEIFAMNADELRALLANCMTELQQGTMTPSQANAITRLVGKKLALMAATLRATKLARPR